MEAVKPATLMRNLRWPRFWLGLWLAAIAIVIVLSLISPPKVDVELPRHFDKLEHFFAYFTLAASAVQLFSRHGMLALVAVLLVLLGIALEFAQGALVPETRQMDMADALANSVGVLCGMAGAFTPFKHCLARIEARWLRR